MVTLSRMSFKARCSFSSSTRHANTKAITSTREDHKTLPDLFPLSPPRRRFAPILLTLGDSSASILRGFSSLSQWNPELDTPRQGSLHGLLDFWPELRTKFGKDLVQDADQYPD